MTALHPPEHRGESQVIPVQRIDEGDSARHTVPGRYFHCGPGATLPPSPISEVASFLWRVADELMT